MTWSYSGDPASSPRDEVRFLVGDTVAASPQVSDEEIDYVLTLHGARAGYSNYEAAAVVARAIAAKYAMKMDKSVGGLSISYSQRHDHYVSLSEALEEQAGTSGVGSRVGAPRLGGGGKTYLGDEFK